MVGWAQDNVERREMYREWREKRMAEYGRYIEKFKKWYEKRKDEYGRHLEEKVRASWRKFMK